MNRDLHISWQRPAYALAGPSVSQFRVSVASAARARDDIAERGGETAVARRFQPRLAVGFDAEAPDAGLRSHDRTVPTWLERLGSDAVSRQIALLAGLAALFALVLERNLAFSFLRARLATVPRYDDVAYLLDAIYRLNFDLANGAAAFWANILAHPPHAPVSTFTAILGFEMFGTEVSSAYVANGWILALYIATLAFIGRPLVTVPARLLFVALFLFAPVSHAMITEFRPDIAAGLVFALALGSVAMVDLRTASLRRRIGVAALCVAATVVKPTGAIVVIPGLGAALLLAVVLQARAARLPLTALLRPVLAPVAAYILLMVPFALVWGPQTAAYIYQALIGNADVWKTEGSPFFHGIYHLFGQGGRLALLPFNWVGLPIIAADLYRLRRAGPSFERTGALTFYGTLAILYAAMALSHEKTQFQGSLFYLPFLLALAAALVRLSLAARTAFGRPFLPTAVLGGLVVLLLLTRPLGSSFTSIPAFADQLPPLLDRLSDRIETFAAQLPSANGCSSRTPILLATNPDPVTPEAVLFELAARGRPLDYRTTYLARSDEEVQDAVAGADLVLIPDPAVPGLNTSLPGSAFGGATLERMKQDGAWTGETMGDVDGAPVWLFTRTVCRSGYQAS